MESYGHLRVFTGGVWKRYRHATLILIPAILAGQFL